MKHLFRIWLVCLPATLFSQELQDHYNADSLALQLKRDSLYIFRITTFKPYLKVEKRNSFLAQFPVNFYGAMGGVTIVDRHILAVGIYVIDPTISKRVYIVNEQTYRFEHLYHGNLSYQLILINQPHFQLNIPVELGFGLLRTRQLDVDGKDFPLRTSRLFPLSSGLQTYFKVRSWVGVSAVLGYRHMLWYSSEVLPLDGWYFSIGFWMDLRHVYRFFRYHHHKKILLNQYRRQRQKELPLEKDQGVMPH